MNQYLTSVSICHLAIPVSCEPEGREFESLQARHKCFVRSQDFGDIPAEAFLARSRSYGVCPSRAP